MAKREILSIERLAAFERMTHENYFRGDPNMMAMAGSLEANHKEIDAQNDIKALRRKFNVIFIFLGGGQDIQIGLDFFWLKPNDLVIVPENMVSTSPCIRECRGFFIYFKTEFLEPVLNGNLSDQFTFFDALATHIIHLNAEEGKLIQNAFLNIIQAYERFSSEKDSFLRDYIHILLLHIRELYKDNGSPTNEYCQRSMILANQFKHLVEKKFLTIRRVQNYAALMNVSPKYLTEVVKNTFGKAPGELIRDMLLEEAKVLLHSTDLSSSQIAFYLNFEDHSYFSRFIRQHTGYSPKELRKIR